jgi:AcrR family transcriptional regulator
MTRSATGAATSPWSPRECELLAVTLELLREHGYDRLTLDGVAVTARASKATLFRRWPTKAELVLAAFVEGTRQVAVNPDTGTLREDLLRLGEQIRAHVSTHAFTIRAVLVETSLPGYLIYRTVLTAALPRSGPCRSWSTTCCSPASPVTTREYRSHDRGWSYRLCGTVPYRTVNQVDIDHLLK